MPLPNLRRGARLSKPAWHFPPRLGGIDYVTDRSNAYFSDAPVPKLVRELIQNSLDAKHRGFDRPVTVRFSETLVERDLIGGDDLKNHLRSCQERAEMEIGPNLASAYSRALSVIEQRTLPCLKVQDLGTTGLDEDRWKALVTQEGAVSKNSGAPGGSFGIGKNAILNVSDLQTVFYGTRLVEGRRGRVEKLQGKATLTGHTDPCGSGEDLQHIGFYSQQDFSPVMGRDIPTLFRLKETGTAVFIMGFNPRASDWVEQMAAAAIENFFHAIHHRRLTVEIAALGKGSVLIDHQSIDHLFDQVAPINRNAVHYYRAIRDCDEDDVHLTKRFGGVGSLKAYVAFMEGAPRRMAHINRNGMLITDSREQKVNPLAPRARGLWPDYVGVVLANTDAGDLWLRRMENASHDSLSSGHLLDEGVRKAADRSFKEIRHALAEIIDSQAEIHTYFETSNLDELADILPDEQNGPGTKALTASLVESRPARFSLGDPDHDPDGGGDEGDGSQGEPGEGNGSAEQDSGEKQGQMATRSERSLDGPSALRSVRFIPLSPTEAIVAFDPPPDEAGEVKLSLAPAGSDPDPRRLPRVAIIEATMMGDEEFPLTVADGQVTLVTDSPHRVTIKVVADGNLDQQAFRLR